MVRHSQQITTADTALDDDMRSRIIRYSITMGIRTACFVAAYFAFVADQHVIMWICVAGAVVLPYPAVIFANAGRERSRDDATALIDQAPQAELPPARGETISEDGTVTDSGETIAGMTVDDETVRGETVADETGEDTTARPQTVEGQTVEDEADEGEQR
nr:DUF3099 domain-containing protein [Brevibacterium atlanticum]